MRLWRAARVLQESTGGSARLSAPWATPAVPSGAGPDFVNAAMVLRSPLMPERMLARLHRIEAAFGRVRRERWGLRTLDLDLIGAGGLVRPDVPGWRRWAELGPEAQRRETPRGLVLPHPRLRDRAFVLLPLAEVAADWRHPVTGRRVAAMAWALPLPARRGLRRLAWP